MQLSGTALRIIIINALHNVMQLTFTISGVHLNEHTAHVIHVSTFDTVSQGPL